MRASRTDLPTGEAKRTAVREMFDTIAPRYDLVNRVMTFGLDARWRRHTIELLALPPGSLVADVACGTGDFARELSARSYRSVGLDLSLGMLHSARAGDAPLACADAARMPVAMSCLDGVVSGFAIRNFSELEPVVAELARVLKPGGCLVAFDRAQPDDMPDWLRDRMLSQTYTAEWIEANGYPPGIQMTRWENGEHEIRLREWRTAFARTGFRLARVMNFIPTISARLAGKAAVSYLPAPLRRRLVTMSVPRGYLAAALTKKVVPSCAAVGTVAFAPKHTTGMLAYRQ